MKSSKIVVIHLLMFIVGIAAGYGIYTIKNKHSKAKDTILVFERNWQDLDENMIDNSREIRLGIYEKENDIDFLEELDVWDRMMEYRQEEEGIVLDKDISDTSEFDRGER